jgi:hypothetical protein
MRRPLTISALLSVALLTAAAAIASTDPVPEEIPATTPPEAATADPESCAAPACHGDLIDPHASDARALRVLGETGGFCTRCHHK